MKIAAEQDNTGYDHHIREHTDSREEQGCCQVKSQHKEIGYRSCLPDQQKECNEKIIAGAEPAEKISHPFFVHQGSYQWQMTFCRQPDLHRLRIKQPVMIQLCQPCKKIHHEELQAEDPDRPGRYLCSFSGQAKLCVQ